MSTPVKTVGDEPEQSDIRGQEPHEAEESQSIGQLPLNLAGPDKSQSFNEGDSAHNTIESIGITTREKGKTRTALCAKCWFIFDNMSEVEGGEYAFPFYSNSSFIKSNSSNGCCLCYQIHKKLEYLDILEDCKCGGVMTVENGPTMWFTMTADWHGNKTDIKSCFHVGENALLPSGGFGTNLKDSLQLTKVWLKGCQGHEGCYVAGDRSLPTRLIHVGNATIAPRLVHSSTLDGHPKYATLSHCWGTMPICTLSMKNIIAYMVEIPLETLSHTFRDAIDVVRGLDIDYIWIDSLCIIQDKDSDDWSKEAGKMASVYGSSFLNIAATNAENGSGGLFYRGASQPNLVFRADAALKSGKVTGTCFPATLWEIWMTSFPLLRRGWVFQEMVLAPRTVHFTWGQLFWECNTINFCSSWPDGKTPWDWGRFTHLIGLLKEPVSEYRWDSIVEEYSKYSLTYGTDRLIAISGVARAMQRTQNREYCVGLWMEDLIHQLCWYREVGYSEHIQPNAEDWRDKYIGPSWSWISLGHCVTFRDIHKNKFDLLHARVISVDIKYATPDPFGAVSSAELHLTCDFPTMLRAPLPEEPPNTHGVFMGHGVDAKMWGVDVNLELRLDYRSKGDTYCLVPLRSKPTGREKANLLSGLLLQPTGDRVGEYRRAGIFTSKQLGGDEDISSAFLRHKRSTVLGGIHTGWREEGDLTYDIIIV